MPQRHRILAVDDNARNLAIVEKTLAGEFQLVTASSGEEALEIADRFRPDLILLDIMMSGIDGYETCRRLRARPGLSGAKILMVSARASAADRLEGYAAGANDYITKPFEPDELIAKLRVYLQLKSVEEIDRLKSDLLSLLSHETRTPLTAILSPAALLLDDPTLSEEQRAFVEMIRGGGQRLLSLIEKVSYLSQLKAGLAPLKREDLAFGELAEEAVADARAARPRADVKVRVQQDPGIGISGDAAQIGTALRAIVDNALRLSPPRSVIEVDVRRNDPWAEVVVRDSGPGIARAFLPRVFEEFAVENIQHHAQGHGLSLAIARRVAELHGGQLLAESDGSGATFRFRLPLRTATARAA